jgi:starvation-inducible outer membrane lipoprotein
MKSQILTGACALALGACASTPTPLPDTTALQAASLPGAAAPLRAADPLAGYTYRAPTGPRDWRDVNQEQTEGN